MLTIPQLARVLRGTAGVLRLDPRGVAVFDGGAGDARRSFLAALVLLPAFVVYMIMDRIHDGPGPQAPVGLFVTVKLLQYVVSWTLFPVVMEGLAGLLNRKTHYFRWLAAYNWIQVPIMLAFLPVALMAGAGLLNAEGLALFNSLTFLVLAFYLGFLARHALHLPVLSAIGVVFLDLILGEAIHTASLGLLLPSPESGSTF